METSDKQFFITLLSITTMLMMIALMILVVANLVATDDEGISQAQIERIRDRIRPVGQVNLKSQVSAVAASSTPVAAASESVQKAEPQLSEDAGEKVYTRICQSCHTTGLIGAPVVGDAEEWKRRLSEGVDRLYSSALKGLNSMPAKGGDPSLSDSEIRAAVDYMLQGSD